uniref:Uncharacterized protein n=1 Tax=Dunaliella tertiolecta TaxID=3047 RepID=A0A7S3VTS2_DUNTE|mmetsp:Transcript_29698/g.76970  ORF Transcript_29698/g.76970 Transcript_29698/m.76970 type:complete len:117 (+) Transcript_29698:66-416(+)
MTCSLEAEDPLFFAFGSSISTGPSNTHIHTQTCTNTHTHAHTPMDACTKMWGNNKIEAMDLKTGMQDAKCTKTIFMWETPQSLITYRAFDNAISAQLVALSTSGLKSVRQHHAYDS